MRYKKKKNQISWTIWQAAPSSHYGNITRRRLSIPAQKRHNVTSKITSIRLKKIKNVEQKHKIAINVPFLPPTEERNWLERRHCGRGRLLLLLGLHHHTGAGRPDRLAFPCTPVGLMSRCSCLPLHSLGVVLLARGRTCWLGSWASASSFLSLFGAFF